MRIFRMMGGPGYHRSRMSRFRIECGHKMFVFSTDEVFKVWEAVIDRILDGKNNVRVNVITRFEELIRRNIVEDHKYVINVAEPQLYSAGKFFDNLLLDVGHEDDGDGG